MIAGGRARENTEDVERDSRCSITTTTHANRALIVQRLALIIILLTLID